MKESKTSKRRGPSPRGNFEQSKIAAQADEEKRRAEAAAKTKRLRESRLAQERGKRG
jgi:hypothetical protein